MRTVLVLSLLALCFSQTSSVSSGEDSNSTDASGESMESMESVEGSREPSTPDEGTEGSSEAPTPASASTEGSGESMESKEGGSEEPISSAESNEQSSEESGEAPTPANPTPGAVFVFSPTTGFPPAPQTETGADQTCPLTYLWCASKQKCLRAWEEPCPAFGPAQTTGVAVNSATSIVAQDGQDVPAQPDVAQTPPAAASLYPSSKTGPNVAPAVPYVPAAGRPLYVPAGSSSASQGAAPASPVVYAPQGSPAVYTPGTPVYTPQAPPASPVVYTPQAPVYNPPAPVYNPPVYNPFSTPVYNPFSTPASGTASYFPPAGTASFPPATGVTGAPFFAGSGSYTTGVGGTTTVFPSFPAGGFGATTYPSASFPAAPASFPAAPATFPAFPNFGAQAPLRPAGCVCGQFCSANGITGVCQADGLTCAQNILPPQCGTTQYGFVGTPRG